jgi:hypothetical protein
LVGSNLYFRGRVGNRGPRGVCMERRVRPETPVSSGGRGGGTVGFGAAKPEIGRVIT